MPSEKPELISPSAKETQFLGNASEFFAEEAYVSPLARFGVALLLLTLAIAAFAHCLHLDLLWDDAARLTNDIRLRSPVGLAYTWRHPLTATDLPLGQTILWLQYRFFGTNHPAVYHAASLLLHICVTLLLWRVLQALELISAGLTTAIYAVHPTVIAAAVLASNQPLLLCMSASLVFCLVFLHMTGTDPIDAADETPRYYQLPRKGWLITLIALISAIVAVTSHPAAFIFPAALLARHACNDSLLPIGRRYIVGLVLAAASGLVVAIAEAVFTHSHNSISFGQSILQWPSIVLLAVTRTFIPPIAFFDPIRDITWLRATLAVAFVVLLIVSIVFRSARSKHFRLLLILYLLTTAPALLSTEGTSDERILATAALLIPLIVTLVAATQFIHILAKRFEPISIDRADDLNGFQRSVRPIAATLIVGSVLAITWIRTAAYADESQLWQTAAAANPQSLQLGLAHAQAILRRPPPLEETADDPPKTVPANPPDNTADAIVVYEALLRDHPSARQALTGLAAALANQQRYDEAIDFYRRALATAPDDAALYDGESQLYAAKGIGPQAVRLSQHAIELNPLDAGAHHDLALQLDIAGRLDEAAILYGHAMQLDPLFCAPRVNLATIWFRQGKIAEASEMLLQATQIDPLNFDAYANAGAMLATLEQWPRAEQMLRAALTIKSDSKDVWKNLSIVLEKESKTKEAQFARDHVARITR